MSHPTANSRLAIALAVWLVLASAAFADDAIANSDIEQGDGATPASWSMARVAADGLKLERSRGGAFAGDWSLTIQNEHRYKMPVSNNWYQRVDARAGSVVRLTAAMRTVDVSAANVCVQCWSSDGSLVGFASTPPMRGTNEWSEVQTKTLTIPATTDHVIVRCALTGTGRVWFDNIELSAVASDDNTNVRSTPTSLDANLQAKLPGELIDVVPIVKDCMVLAYLPKWNHGHVDNLAVATNSGGVRSLLQWSEIDEKHTTAKRNRFLLALYSRRTTSRGTPSDLVVSALASDWPEKCSWETQPRERADVAVVRRAFGNEEGWQLFDVTSIVERQHRTQAKRHGVVLRFDQVQSTQASSQDFAYLRQRRGWSGYSFVSREGAGEWLRRRPVLLVVQSD